MGGNGRGLARAVARWWWAGVACADMAVCKTYDFAWQKDTFCRPKGDVLQGKRYGFAGRRGVCWFAWSSWGGAIVVLMEVNKCDVLGGGQ